LDSVERDVEQVNWCRLVTASPPHVSILLSRLRPELTNMSKQAHRCEEIPGLSTFDLVSPPLSALQYDASVDFESLHQAGGSSHPAHDKIRSWQFSDTSRLRAPAPWLGQALTFFDLGERRKLRDQRSRATHSG